MGSPKNITNKRVLICNTGRCKGTIKITDEIRPRVEVTGGGVHMLSAEDSGLPHGCPLCGSDSGFVDKKSAKTANSFSKMFSF
jgi:hypothetical protein